jgi:hypothetical protein
VQNKKVGGIIRMVDSCGKPRRSCRDVSVCGGMGPNFPIFHRSYRDVELDVCEYERIVNPNLSLPRALEK